VTWIRPFLFLFLLLLPLCAVLADCRARAFRAELAGARYSVLEEHGFRAGRPAP
jgi:hypothetical protein